MTTPRDDLTADVLGLLDAYARGHHDLMTTTIASMNTADLHHTITQLIGLLDLRTKVGAEHLNLQQWVEYVRQLGITL